jgi:hypothetical protein
MNKDRDTPRPQHDVGPAGKISHVESEPQTSGMQGSAHDAFGRGVFPPDRRHHPAPCLCIDDIGHLKHSVAIVRLDEISQTQASLT